MKTCVMECYTHRWNKIDHLFKYHQMQQIGLKKRPYQQIVGPYLLSNWLLSSMLHFFLKSGFFAKTDNSSSSRTPKFKIFKYEWAMVNSSHDTSSTKTKFLSMDFKPLQIRELQASSNPLPKLYIRGSSLHRKQKPQ